MKKFLIIIILVVLVGVGIVFCIDQNRMKNNEPVLFSTWGAKYVPPENEVKENVENKANNEVENNIENEISSFVGTIVEEEASYIMIEPIKGEFEGNSPEKIVIGLDENRDYLYGVGRKVIIEFDGTIMTTYPAQINMTDIKTDGYSDFEIIIEKSDEQKEEKILNNKQLYELNSDYDLYYVGVKEVNVKVNNKEMSLEDALKNGYLTLDGIISKANEDDKNRKIKTTSYDDGGTMVYYYEGYTIKKMHTLDGNRDLYIMKST